MSNSPDLRRDGSTAATCLQQRPHLCGARGCGEPATVRIRMRHQGGTTAEHDRCAECGDQLYQWGMGLTRGAAQVTSMVRTPLTVAA